MPSQEYNFWTEMVDNWNDLRNKIGEYEHRVFTLRQLGSIQEGEQYSKWLIQRDTLIKSMGAEFPNLFVHHKILRENKVPITADYWEDKYNALLDDLPTEKPIREEYGTLESYRDDYALWELRQKHAPKRSN